MLHKQTLVSVFIYTLLMLIMYFLEVGRDHVVVEVGRDHVVAEVGRDHVMRR